MPLIFRFCSEKQRGVCFNETKDLFQEYKKLNVTITVNRKMTTDKTELASK